MTMDLGIYVNQTENNQTFSLTACLLKSFQMP